VSGEWELAQDNIERCLELWDTDGPTKALQYYIQFYKFLAPSNWNGYRDIDEPIDLDKINQEHNYDATLEEDQIDQDPASPDKDSKSKSGLDKKSQGPKESTEGSNKNKKKKE
jgi:hypothetical protein